MNALAGLAAASAALSGMLALALEASPRVLDRLVGGRAGAVGKRRGALRWAASAVGVVAGLVVAGWAGALAASAAIWIVPRVRVRRDRRKRDDLVRLQLPDALGTLAAALRAGMSLSRSVSFAADNGEKPLAQGLREVSEREAMGVPLSESLRTWCDSLPSAESRLLAAVLDLHQRSGGEFATVLERVARTLRDRESIEREARSLTAQGRLSGIILGVLPFAFLAFLLITSPGEMAASFHSPLGLLALGVGLAMQGLAFLWIRTLLRVEP